MTKCERFLVRGRVQGVGFRAATQAQAQTLGLAGWVRNLPDGGVEVLAAGPPETLAALRRWLQQGPPAARVTAVECSEAAADGTLPVRFSVR